METPIVLPQLGNEITEALVEVWMKAVGDSVKAGEAVLSISTSKVSVEIEAPVSGTLSKILVEADELADVGATLGLITS